MRRRFLLICAAFFAFILSAVVADEQENIISEDFVLLLDKINRVLKEKDFEKFRIMYPQLVNELKFWNEYELTKDHRLSNNYIENSNEDQVSISSNDISDSTFQLLPADGIKLKRAYHRALCHFKLCNMGSKRSRFWNMVWRRNT